MVLLDTHPDYMSFNQDARPSGQYPVRFYRELLEYLRSSYADQYWHALPGALATYVQRLASRERPSPASTPFLPSRQRSNRRPSRSTAAIPIKRRVFAASAPLFSCFPTFQKTLARAAPPRRLRRRE